MDECLVQCEAMWPFCKTDFSMFPYERVKCRNVRLNTFLLIFHLITYIFILDIELTRFSTLARRYREPQDYGNFLLVHSPAYHNIYNISSEQMFELANTNVYLHLLIGLSCLANVSSSDLDFIFWFPLRSPTWWREAVIFVPTKPTQG